MTPINNLYTKTVSSLCYSLCDRDVIRDHVRYQTPYNDVVQFVFHQHKQMTSYLRLPMTIATLVFTMISLLTKGTFFHRLSPENRMQQIKSWKTSSLGFFRDFIRFYESLSILALFSRDQQEKSLHEILMP